MYFISKYKRLVNMNKLFLFIVFFSGTTLLSAQTYNFSGGIRLGTEIGISIKVRVADKLTLEGIVQSPIQEEEAIISLLLEKHNSVLTKGLNIYYGGGVQKGFVFSEVREFEDPFGAVVIIGAEFNFARLNLSYDLKPAINIIGGSAPVILQTGLSVRYIFDKRDISIIDPKKRAKKKKQKAKDKVKKAKEKAKKKRFKEKLKEKYERKGKS